MTYTEKRLEEFDNLSDYRFADKQNRAEMRYFIATSIAQAIAEERANVVESMMMKGIEAKMTPFQTTVNQYLRNRAEEIGIDIRSLDKPLTDKE